MISHHSSRSRKPHRAGVFFRRYGWLSGFLTVALLVGYLFQVNSVATKTYELKRLGDRVEKLRRDNQKINRTIASEQSNENITARLLTLEFVSPERVEYLTPVGTVVAAR